MLKGSGVQRISGRRLLARTWPLLVAVIVAAVAGFAQLLRHEPHLKDFSYERVIQLAQAIEAALAEVK